MSQEPTNLTVLFIEPPEWTAPAPEVWEQLKPPKKRRNKGKWQPKSRTFGFWV